MRITTKLFWLKKVALTLIVILLAETCLPTISWALTSGPSKPEVQSFESVSTTEMVDLFSGDFTYNIPLFELPGSNGGYPFNLHYNAGINMDQEASWVGLGWNLNPGAITRNLQGLPDEYDGSIKVLKEADIKPSTSYGANIAGSISLLGADSDKAAGESASASLTLGITLKYNNYKGFGYSLDAGLSYSSKDFGPSNMSAGAGLGLSLDSQSGVGVDLTPNLTIGGANDNIRNSFQVGIGYNSREGLNKYSFTVNNAKWDHSKLVKTKKGSSWQRVDNNKGGTSSYTVMSGGYIPPLSTPMQTRYTSLSFKPGFGLFGVFGNVSLGGFYSKQYVAQNDMSSLETGYGYLYAHKDTDGRALLDYNREKDGALHKRSSNLPIPIATADIFTMTSQGMSSMFRAFRNDYGVYHDLYKEGVNVGGTAGFEIAPHAGFEASFGYGETKTLRWTEQNDAAITMAFNAGNSNPGQEAYYFQTYGEATPVAKDLYDNIGGEDAVAVKFDNIDISKNRTLANQLTKKKDSDYFPLTAAQINTTKRGPRNTPVQYLDPDKPEKGMYSINSDGSIYIFGKKQMVLKDIECMYSVDAGNYDQCTKHVPGFNILNDNGNPKPKYKSTGAGDNTFNNVDYMFNRTTLKDYAYTYLISEIRGADYVDADGSGTVTPGDKGYWVKFNYTDVNKAPTAQEPSFSAYNWRSPYYGGNFIAGKLTTLRDNKASYAYGEKEVSYLSSVETNSHIAYFNITPRKDARGASGELANTNAVNGASSYKLEYISLYSREDATNPLMKVYFDYSYDLCKGVLNNDKTNDTLTALGKSIPNGGGSTKNNGSGKLTLKKIWIEHGNNKRGRLNPYKFDYHEDENIYGKTENPDYVLNNFDRWGFNRATAASPCDNPYVPQFDDANGSFKDDANRAAASYSLKSITLPSGALINIDYETDDYAYVQDKRATQMFKIRSLKSAETPSGLIAIDCQDDENRKVVFDLETPIAGTSKTQAETTFRKQYLEGITEVYFRVYGPLLTGLDGRKDYVAGYSGIKSSGLEDVTVGGKYTRGYLILSSPKVGDKTFDKYHPFSVAFWQSLMTDYPELPFTGSISFADNEAKEERRAKLSSLVSSFGALMAMFTGFYSYANQKTWGRNIAVKGDPVSCSYIRLNAPDKIKIGGGIRVKKITLSDQWNKMQPSAAESVYGQVYDYTTIDDNKNVISSGVATYEPMTGGDENALRNAKVNFDKIPLKLSLNVMFETPINESYYPGASVGYSKITVKSLASYQNETHTNVPAGILTTGATCNEFYTYKDFPVKTFETPLRNIKDPFIIPLPFVGSTTDIRVTASQGYSIQLNDMHGKPRKTTVFRQNDNGSIDYSSPVSYIEYKYKSDMKKDQKQQDYALLNNQVPVLIKKADGTIVKSNNYLIGEKIEFFTDMREQVCNNTMGGVSFNLEIFPITIFTIPIPAPWPSVDYSRTRVRTVVTNKIIHKFGIIDSIIAYNGSATIKTKNLVFDGVTGQPILTSVTNNFDDPVYNFEMPSHMVYSGLAAAYTSIGASFTGNLASGYAAGQATRNNERLITVTGGTGYSLVKQGDILTFYSSNNTSYTGVVTRASGTSIYIQSTAVPLPNANGLRFYITYPGNKNQLDGMSGSVTTLGDRTKGLINNPIDQLYGAE